MFGGGGITNSFEAEIRPGTNIQEEMRNMKKEIQRLKQDNKKCL
jgi:hypothetical protein